MSKYRREPIKYCPGYEIDTNGVIYGKRGKPLKPAVNHTGYQALLLMVNKVPTCFQVHLLVANQFLPNPKDCTHIKHKNGNKLDNRLDNLEWHQRVRDIN